MNGWRTNKLSSLGVVQTGSTPKTSVKENFGNFIPFIKPADFQPDGVIKYKNDGLSEKGLAESRLIKKNSVVMVCIGATIGKVGYTTIDVTSNQQINSFTPFDGLLTKYCYYAMLADSFKRRVIFSSGQATLPIINKTKWSNLELTYPDDIEEQKRIVAILDQAFADIEQARAKTEQNLRNARELFESYLQQVFSQRGEGWVESTVGEQITLQRGFDITKKQQRTGEVPVVSSGGIKSYHDTHMVTGPGVVIGRKGSLGTVFYIENNYWPHDTTLWIKEFNGNNPRLVYYFFLGLNVKHLDSGAANPALNRNFVHPIKTSWPKQGRQKELVSKLDALALQIQRLENIYQQKLEELDELKKSILQKAFTGQLTHSVEPTEGKGAAA